MNRVIGAVIAAVMLMASLAVPAAANPVPADHAALAGTVGPGMAHVGKVAGVCTKNGGTDPTGGGLGLPQLSRNKNAHFRMVAPVVTRAGTGTVEVCGFLEPTLSALQKPGKIKPGIGASCGLSKAHSGKGRIEIVGQPTIYLNNVGWKISVGGLLPVSGEANTAGKTKGTGPNKDGTRGSQLSALLLAQGGQDCMTKRDNPNVPEFFRTSPGKPAGQQGATRFTIVGDFKIVPGATYVRSNDLPVLCKDFPANPGCLFRPKKLQKE